MCCARVAHCSPAGQSSLAVGTSGFLLHQDQCFVALVPYAGHSPVSAPRVGLSFHPWPTSCLCCNPLGSASKRIFRLSQVCWTPAYLADFPRSAWAWNHPLSPFQYATFQFPQLFSGFGNDLAERIGCASLSYRQTYPGGGRPQLATSNSAVCCFWLSFLL